MNRCGKPSQIVAILGSVGKDKSIENICREHGISPATFYNRKNKYGGIGTDELKRMRELEAENARLKKISADKSLDYDILKVGRFAAAIRITKKDVSPISHQQNQC